MDTGVGGAPLSLKAVHVKEKRELDGASPPAAVEAVHIKEESMWDQWDSARKAAAEQDRPIEVKIKFEEGQEQLQPQDVAFNMQYSSYKTESSIIKQEQVAPTGADEPQCIQKWWKLYSPRNCYIKLKRILVNKELHTCIICRRSFLQESSLTTHMGVHTVDSFNITNSEDIIRVSTGKKCLCNTCGKWFISKSKLRRHLQIHTGKKPYSCEICYKQFALDYNLTYHMYIHTKDKPYECPNCKKQFRVKSRFTTHKCRKTYTCNGCNKLFKYKARFAAHMCEEKVFACEICKKQFPRNFHLIRHKLTHTGEKLFSCEFCQRQFTRKCDLERHMPIHTSRNLLTCDICNKQFITKYHLTKHIQMHAKEEPFKRFSCDICGAEFTRMPHLTRHKLIHTNARPYSCETCRKHFQRKSELSRHMFTPTHISLSKLLINLHAM